MAIQDDYLILITDEDTNLKTTAIGLAEYVLQNPPGDAVFVEKKGDDMHGNLRVGPSQNLPPYNIILSTSGSGYFSSEVRIGADSVNPHILLLADGNAYFQETVESAHFIAKAKNEVSSGLTVINEPTGDINFFVQGSGNITTNGELLVKEAITGEETLDILGAANIGGITELGDDLFVAGNVYVADGFDAVFGKDVLIKDFLTVQGGMFIDGNVGIDGTLDVSDLATFASNVIIEENLTVQDNLLVQKLSTFQNDATFETDVFVRNALEVDGFTTLNNDVTIANASKLEVTGTLYVALTSNFDGAVTINDTLTVNNTTYIDGDFIVADGENSVLGGELTVKENSTFLGDVVVDDGQDLTVGNDLLVKGDARINKTLSIGNSALVDTNDVGYGFYKIKESDSDYTLVTKEWLDDEIVRLKDSLFAFKGELDVTEPVPGDNYWQVGQPNHDPDKMDPPLEGDIWMNTKTGVAHPSWGPEIDDGRTILEFQTIFRTSAQSDGSGGYLHNGEWVTGSTQDIQSLPDATDTNRGITFLSDSITSPSNAATGATAASPLAVRTLEEKKVDRAGDTMTGDLTIDNADGNFIGDLIGNASTATQLETGREINDVYFDGTQDITIEAALKGKLQMGDYLDIQGDPTNIFDGLTNEIVNVLATPDNTFNYVVARDANGNFEAQEITAFKFIGDLEGTARDADKVNSTLTAGNHMIFETFDGSADKTFSVDGTPADISNKVVVRDAQGDFAAREITATGRFIGYLDGTARDADMVNSTLTAGAFLLTESFNGSADKTFNVDGTPAATADKVVTRDSNGDFRANKIRTTLTNPLDNSDVLVTKSYVDFNAGGSLTPGIDLAGTVYTNDNTVTFDVESSVLNAANRIVKRDANGDFSSRIITANEFIGDLTGTAEKAQVTAEGTGTYDMVLATNGSGSRDLKSSNKLQFNIASGDLEIDGNLILGGDIVGSAIELNDLKDVTLSGLQTNDILRYDGTEWINTQFDVPNVLVFRGAAFLTESVTHPNNVDVPNSSDLRQYGDFWVNNSAAVGFVHSDWNPGNGMPTNAVGLEYVVWAPSDRFVSLGRTGDIQPVTEIKAGTDIDVDNTDQTEPVIHVVSSITTQANSIVKRDSAGSFEAAKITMFDTVSTDPSTVATTKGYVDALVGAGTGGVHSAGTHLVGPDYDATSDVTWYVNASSASTNSVIVTRDSAGSFAANKITNSPTTAADGDQIVTTKGYVDSEIAKGAGGTLTRGNYLTGNNYNGANNTTWNVDATTSNTPNKVVVRDGNGDFQARHITAPRFIGVADQADEVKVTTSSSNRDYNVPFVTGVSGYGGVYGNNNFRFNPSTGGIEITGQLFSTTPLNNLGDVTINSPKEDEFLQYSAGVWRNARLEIPNAIKFIGVIDLTKPVNDPANVSCPDNAVDRVPGWFWINDDSAVGTIHSTWTGLSGLSQGLEYVVWTTNSRFYVLGKTGDTAPVLEIKAGDGIYVDNSDRTHPEVGIKTQVGLSSGAYNNPDITVNDLGIITAIASGSQTGATLTPGSYITGQAYDGSQPETWAVDATTTSTANKVVARDSNSDILCRGANVKEVYSTTGLEIKSADGFNLTFETGNANSEYGFKKKGSSAVGIIRPRNITTTRYYDMPDETGTLALTSIGTSTNVADTVVRRDGSGSFATQRISVVTSSINAGTDVINKEYADANYASGSTAGSLTPGSGLQGGVFDGSTDETFSVDGTSTPTANKVAIRDGSGHCDFVNVTATQYEATSASMTFVNKGTATNQYFFRKPGTASTNGGFDFSNITANRKYEWPDQSGTVALLSDLGGGGTPNPTPDTIMSRDSTGSTRVVNLTATTKITAAEFDSSSDQRKKTNIINVDDSTKILKEINGVRFTWTETDEDSLGVIAQDIEKVLPELVKEDKDGYKSVNYNGLIGVLIESVKELTQRVEVLESES